MFICGVHSGWKLQRMDVYFFKGSFTVIISDHELTYLAWYNATRNYSHDSPNQSWND